MKILGKEVPKNKVLLAYLVFVFVVGFIFGVKYTHVFYAYISSREIASLQEYKGLYLKSEFYKVQRDKKFEKKVAYWNLIKKYSKQYGIDPAIPATVQVLETGYLPFDQRVVAVSRAGAIGLQQIMPFHAKANGYKKIDLYNPYINIKLSCMLLSQLHKKYGGNMDKILSAYNGGHRQAIKINSKRIPETRRYVIKGINSYQKLSSL